MCTLLLSLSLGKAALQIQNVFSDEWQRDKRPLLFFSCSWFFAQAKCIEAIIAEAKYCWDLRLHMPDC